MKRQARWVLVGAALATLIGCANMGIGLSLPIGRIGGVGVSVGGDGQVGVGVGVGSGGVSVGVGGTLPRPSEPPASASTPASAPLR